MKTSYTYDELFQEADDGSGDIIFTIPEEFCKEFGVEENDVVDITTEPGKTILEFKNGSKIVLDQGINSIDEIEVDVDDII